MDRLSTSSLTWVFLPILSVTAFVFINYYIFSLTRNSVSQQLKQNVSHQTKIISISLEQYLLGKREMVEMLAAFDQLRLFLDDATQETLKQHELLSTVVSILRDSIGSTSKEYAIAWVASTRDDFSMSYDVVSFEDGNWNIVTGEKTEKPNNWKTKERPWYANVMAQEGVFLENPYPDAETGQLCVSLIKKVYNDNNEHVGFAGLDLFLQPINEVMQSFIGEMGGYPILVGSDDTVLYHPQSKYIFKYKLNEIDPAFEKVFPYLHKGLNDTIVVDLQEEQAYIGFSSINGAPWSVVMVNSEKVVDEPIVFFKYSLGFAACANLVFLMLPVGLFFLLARNRQNKFRYMQILYDLAVNQMQIGVSVLDAKTGHCELINNAYKEFLGFTDEQVFYSCILRDAIDLEHELPPEVGEICLELPRGTISGDMMLGWDRYFNHQFQSFRDQSGAEKYLSVLTEITEMRQMQETLRTARDLAETANRAKSSFLANMSHEIRTPMNGVIGLTNLLAQTGLTPSQMNYVHLIQQSAASLLTIINDILDYSKIEAGKIEIESHPFPLKEFINDSCMAYRIECEKKGLQLKLNVDEHLPTVVLGDSHRLRQVLTNLASNAIKFTASGDITITVELDHTEPNRSELAAENGYPSSHLGSSSLHWIRFEVRDSGIGIPQHKIEKLFKPFSQVDESTTRQYGGTGLGLSICKQLVELMAGSIDCYSQEGKGTDFWFVVPLTETTLEIPWSTPAVEIQKKTVVHPCNILLVDDVHVNLLVLGTMVKNLGHRIDTANDGAAALQKLREHDYDMVFMDCQMPIMDGYRCTALVRSKTAGVRNPAIPIIAVTANAMQGDREICLNAGMDDYITKPIDQDALVAKIAKWASAPNPAAQ